MCIYIYISNGTDNSGEIHIGDGVNASGGVYIAGGSNSNAGVYIGNGVGNNSLIQIGADGSGSLFGITIGSTRRSVNIGGTLNVNGLDFFPLMLIQKLQNLPHEHLMLLV